MKRRRAWALGALLLVPVLMTACGGGSGEADQQPPAVTQRVKGTDVTQVKLTAQAATRLGLELGRVRSDGAGTLRTVIPYAAVLYSPDGATWTYTSPKPLVFQRAAIRIARITGDTAILTRGPTVGTRVVTTGATEIWGVEYGDIKEDR